MFGCGKQDSLLHQTGGIADARNIPTLCFDVKTIKITATEDDAGVGRRRKEPEVAEDAGVKTHTLGRSFSCDGGLEHNPTSRIALCWPWFYVFVHAFQ